MSVWVSGITGAIAMFCLSLAAASGLWWCRVSQFKLAARRFGAQATLDAPLRRSLRAKVAFHVVALATALLEVPQFLAFEASCGSGGGGGSTVVWKWPWPSSSSSSSSGVPPPLALVSYWGGHAAPSNQGCGEGFLGCALGAHLLALAGYPILVVITVGMWAEVVRNVPGTHRLSLASSDRGARASPSESNRHQRQRRRSHLLTASQRRDLGDTGATSTSTSTSSCGCFALFVPPKAASTSHPPPSPSLLSAAAAAVTIGETPSRHSYSHLRAPQRIDSSEDGEGVDESDELHCQNRPQLPCPPPSSSQTEQQRQLSAALLSNKADRRTVPRSSQPGDHEGSGDDDGGGGGGGGDDDDDWEARENGSGGWVGSNSNRGSRGSRSSSVVGGGAADGVESCESWMASREVVCCGTRPLAHKPTLVFAVFAYTIVQMAASISATMYVKADKDDDNDGDVDNGGGGGDDGGGGGSGDDYDGGVSSSYLAFVSHNEAYALSCLLEPPVLILLSLAVAVSGQLLLRRVKHSMGERMKRAERKISLVAGLVTALLCLRALLVGFAVVLTVVVQNQEPKGSNSFWWPANDDDGGGGGGSNGGSSGSDDSGGGGSGLHFRYSALRWVSMAAVVVPYGGLIAGLLPFMQAPRRLPARIEMPPLLRHESSAEVTASASARETAEPPATRAESTMAEICGTNFDNELLSEP